MIETSNDRLAMIEDHLAQADRHINEAETRISRQEIAIAERARTGRGTTAASSLLQTMRDTLALMHEHRKILLSQREQAIRERTSPHKL